MLVDILAVFNDKLLVSSKGLSQLYIYNRDHLTTITIRDTLYDATWTPQGNIMYTSVHSDVIVVMSESGEGIFKHTKIPTPRYLSVSCDSKTYVTALLTGLYQSTDDGASWSLIFRSRNGWLCFQVIKVNTEHSDDYWTVECDNQGLSEQLELSVYSVNRNSYDGKVTRKKVRVSSSKGPINVYYSGLSYDCNKNIFLSEMNYNAVHMLLVNGTYDRQVRLSHSFNSTMSRKLVVDHVHKLLYIGLFDGYVSVFRLTDSYGGD